MNVFSCPKALNDRNNTVPAASVAQYLPCQLFFPLNQSYMFTFGKDANSGWALLQQNSSQSEKK